MATYCKLRQSAATSDFRSGVSARGIACVNASRASSNAELALKCRATAQKCPNVASAPEQAARASRVKATRSAVRPARCAMPQTHSFRFNVLPAHARADARKSAPGCCANCPSFSNSAKTSAGDDAAGATTPTDEGATEAGSAGSDDGGCVAGTEGVAAWGAGCSAGSSPHEVTPTHTAQANKTARVRSTTFFFITRPPKQKKRPPPLWVKRASKMARAAGFEPATN